MQHQEYLGRNQGIPQSQEGGSGSNLNLEKTVNQGVTVVDPKRRRVGKDKLDGLDGGVANGPKNLIMTGPESRARNELH